MIAITKGPAPERLAALSERTREAGLSPKEAYRRMKTSLKRKVRENLVREQGGLCAYCMCRIPRPDVPPKIVPVVLEHIVPRDPEDARDEGQGLDYRNMVAVCHGNQAERGARHLIDLTCDAHKKNTEFRKVNPCRAETLTSIFYHMDGKIDAADEDVRFDLVRTLNLNCPSSPLVAERKAVLDSLIEAMSQVPAADLPAFCTAVRDEFAAETDKKTPYVGILLWYLDSMIDTLR